MKRLIIATIATIALAVGMYFAGLYSGSEATVEEPGGHLPPPEVRVIKSALYERQDVVTEVIVWELELNEFPDRHALGQWQAQNYLEDVEEWVCVDYALELQRLALEDGYLMSVQLIDTDFDKEIDHAICATWIGDKCYFIEPQSTTNWVGAIRGG